MEISKGPLVSDLTEVGITRDKESGFPGLVSVQTSHWWMFKWTGVGVALGCHDDDLLPRSLIQFYCFHLSSTLTARYHLCVCDGFTNCLLIGGLLPWKPLQTFMSGPDLYLLRTLSVRDIYYHIVECRFPHLVRFSIKFIYDCNKKSSFFNFRSRRLTDWEWAMFFYISHVVFLGFNW